MEIREAVKGVYNLKHLSKDKVSTLLLEETPHIYSINKYSRDPTITWDVGLYQGQPTFKFPTLNPALFSIDHFNVNYNFIENKEFSLPVIQNRKPLVAPFSKDQSFIKWSSNELSTLGIIIQPFSNYDYNQAIRDRIEGSPYFVETTKKGNTCYEGLPQTTHVSGYDCYSLVLLLKIASKLSFYSASFKPEHKIIWS